MENYFSILRIRYAGSFEYSIHTEEDELLSCLIPKLILQPLAENSVMHGSSDDGSVMEIMITCWEENGNIMIERTDNGQRVLKYFLLLHLRPTRIAKKSEFPM